MKCSFSIAKIDNINLRKFNIKMTEYKKDIKKIINIILNLEELNSSKIFKENISKIDFDISFCNDETIKNINKTYRNKDSATDVITFSLFTDDENSIVSNKVASLGEIIISIETADRQKKENNNDLKIEILTLICHGILHLFGFDHLTKRDYDFVVRIQKEVIRNYEQV